MAENTKTAKNSPSPPSKEELAGLIQASPSPLEPSPKSPTPSLRLTEIFYSLQGESTLAGLPTIFIRLTGCPLRCTYCDTAYAFHGGHRWPFPAILAELTKYPTRYVCVTGGEPLAQPNCPALLRQLIAKNYRVSLETSGALSIAPVPPAVIKILDLKTPSSGEQTQNLWPNIDLLRPHDQVKFVVADAQDFAWAQRKIAEHRLTERVAAVLISPVHGAVDLANLAQQILNSGTPLRLQLQQHKYIWGDTPGH